VGCQRLCDDQARDKSLDKDGVALNRIILIGIISVLITFGEPALSQGVRSGSGKKSDAKIKLAHPEIPRIPAKELAQLLKNKADIVVVDTQTSDGYEMWHITSAVNIPYVSTEDPTNRQFMLMALPMDKTIVIYCLCEEGTDSAKLAIELLRLGYCDDKVKVLEGGLVLWDGKDYPMVKQKLPE
jgi:rhodanese-related sulfurtransferase